KPFLGSFSSAGSCQTDMRTPDDTSRSTMRGSAGLVTAIRQSGHENRYAPSLFVEHTRTWTSPVVNSTSPQVGQLARMVANEVLPSIPLLQLSTPRRRRLSTNVPTVRGVLIPSARMGGVDAL